MSASDIYTPKILKYTGSAAFTIRLKLRYASLNMAACYFYFMDTAGMQILSTLNDRNAVQHSYFNPTAILCYISYPNTGHTPFNKSSL